ncbi:MAG TPA: hypothetical protein PK263_07090 [bacterium]|jgi:type II secretory pathway component PulL|nr:hypothetical protein [bacterium]
MGLEKIISIGCRVLFYIALILLLTALGEKASNLAGYTFLQKTTYSPWRLLEFAAIFLLFVITMVLRQIREELKQSK